jgi:hypothetical protein
MDACNQYIKRTVALYKIKISKSQDQKLYMTIMQTFLVMINVILIYYVPLADCALPLFSLLSLDFSLSLLIY